MTMGLRWGMSLYNPSPSSNGCFIFVSFSFTTEYTEFHGVLFSPYGSRIMNGVMLFSLQNHGVLFYSVELRVLCGECENPLRSFSDKVVKSLESLNLYHFSTLDLHAKF